MSDWHPKIRAPASFRGVPFFVESAEQAGGRRGPIHEFPFKQKAFFEDTGRKVRTFPVEGFVVGTDYMDARDALINACESEDGPGELIHPHFGTRRVAVENYRVRETTNEGGAARISIEFIESDAALSQPSAVKDTTAAVSAGALAATAAVGAEFLKTFDAGLALVGSVVTALRSATRQIDSALAKIDMEVQALAALKRQVSEFSASIVALVNEPASLLAQNVAIFESIATGLIAAGDGITNPAATMVLLYAFDPGARPPSTTATRIREQVNFDAVCRLHQRLALIQAAKIAITQPFASYDEAAAVRTSITDLLDAQAEIVADDTFPALAQLRADLVRAVPGDALEFARLLSHTPTVNVPSLVLAHRLYGDLSLEQDLIRRNRIQNPAFVLGGVELEVLSRAD